MLSYWAKFFIYNCSVDLVEWVTELMGALVRKVVVVVVVVVFVQGVEIIGKT